MSGSTGSAGFIGITPPRASEGLDERLVRILREFRRPSVPFDLLARVADEPEDVVTPALKRLEQDGVVKLQGPLVVLLQP